MTDLCMYEFEDTVWDEFCQSDDHIVPHPGLVRFDAHSILTDSCKKPRSEVTGASGETGDKSAANYVEQERKQGGFSYLRKRRNPILDKGPWSRSPSGVFPSSDSDSMKEESNIASDNTRTSSHGFQSNNMDSNGSEFCAEDTILGEKSAAVGNNSFSYPLGDLTHASNSLDFFENPEDKDSSDFLYYGWPEIGNFDDVDRMFRNCDSTFGLGASKEDELGWFSSADEIGGSGDVLNPDFKFPGSNAVENISGVSANSDSCISFANNSANVDTSDRFPAKEKVDEHKKQVKSQNQFAERRKDQFFGNGHFSYMSDLPNEATQLSSEANSHQSAHLHQLSSGANNHAYLQKPMSGGDADKCNFPDPSMINPSLSAVKSEADGLTSHSSKDSSHASSQLQSRERGSHDTSFPDSAISKKEKVHDHLGDIEGVGQIISAELGSSNVQESTTTSGLDDISLEAASFRQLQLVMEKLDLRTKLCIRDSLYRLARSAEQRHNHENLDGFGDERESGSIFMADGTNKNTSFMDIETDTNPIDRSIAHLLFHRPSESPTGVHGSITSPVKVENVVTHEESTPDIEKMVSGH